jgi:hypothetical protein
MQIAVQPHNHPLDPNQPGAAPPERKPWQPLRLQILEIGQHTQKGGIPTFWENDLFSPLAS